jgi:hypothetical protein
MLSSNPVDPGIERDLLTRDVAERGNDHYPARSFFSPGETPGSIAPEDSSQRCCRTVFEGKGTGDTGDATIMGLFHDPRLFRSTLYLHDPDIPPVPNQFLEKEEQRSFLRPVPGHHSDAVARPNPAIPADLPLGFCLDIGNEMVAAEVLARVGLEEDCRIFTLAAPHGSTRSNLDEQRCLRLSLPAAKMRF